MMAKFINKEMMEKSCRICMARFAKYNILGFKSRNLAEEINYCTGILISHSDTLSTKICTKCLKNLTVAYKFKKQCLETDNLLRQSQTVVHTDSQTIKTDIYPDSQKSESDICTTDSLISQAQTHTDSQNVETETCTVSQHDKTDVEIKEEIINRCNNDAKLPKCNNDAKLPNDDIKISTDDNSVKVENDVQTDSRTLVIEYLEKGILKINDDDKLKIEKLESEVTDHQLDDKDREWKYDDKEEDSEDDNKNSLAPIKKKGRFWQFKCTSCNIHFNRYTSYVKHNVKVHNELESYVCEICGHNTKTYYSYSRHRKLHKEPKYHCDSCDYKSCYKSNLILHVATHSDDRRYQCEQCGDTFRTTRGRYNHVRIVHQNKKRTKCEKCYKVFSDKYKLRRHMDTHFNIKRHECEVCLVKYTDRANLKKHMLTAHNVAIPRLQRQYASRSYDPNYQ